MSRFTNLLEYSCAGNIERKQILKRPSFDRLFTSEEKQLMLTEAGESELVLTEAVGAIVEGAKSRESARNVLPVVNTISNRARITYGSSPSGQYAGYVAEGAAPQIDTVNYSTPSPSGVTIKKAAVCPSITSELIDDSKFDIIELELKKAGAKLENKLNQEVITTLLDGATTPDVDPGGTYIAMADVGIAKGRVDSAGWMADSVFLHPMAFGWMLDETNLGDITKGDNKLLKLNVQILDAVVDGTGTAEWTAVDAASNYCGLVFDSLNFAIIAMREDINVSRIDDPINDLVKLKAEMRFGVGVLNSDAGCRILTQ